MAESVELRKKIQALLKEECSKVFYREARGGQSGNYIVYNVNGIRYDEVVEQAELEVFAICSGNNSLAIETLADTIWQKFDHLMVNSDDISFSLYQNIKNDISDDNMVIIRLTFEIRIYKEG